MRVNGDDEEIELLTRKQISEYPNMSRWFGPSVHRSSPATSPAPLCILSSAAGEPPGALRGNGAQPHFTTALCSLWYHQQVFITTAAEPEGAFFITMATPVMRTETR